VTSPYEGVSPERWSRVTAELVEAFPLKGDELVAVAMASWEEIYASSFGNGKLVVGRDIFLPAQATGVIFERLFALNLNRNDTSWRGGRTKAEKDIVFDGEAQFSFEVKTSSSRDGIFGNRSTGLLSNGRRKR